MALREADDRRHGDPGKAGRGDTGKAVSPADSTKGCAGTEGDRIPTRTDTY